MTPVVSAGPGRAGSPVTGSMKSSGGAQDQGDDAVHLGELDDLGLLGA